jgi:hypothetical protein
MITSIPSILVMRRFGSGKRVPFVFPTSPECVVLPVFSTTEAADKFCKSAAEPLSPLCLSHSDLAKQLQEWVDAEPPEGMKLLAMNMAIPVPPRFRAAKMADALAALQRGGDTVQTDIYDFVDVQ